jgi:hypothetical protein
LVGLCACKGETKTVVDTSMKDQLDTCLKNAAEKDKLIKDEEEANARMQRNGGGEIVVTLEGNMMTVKPAAAGGPAHPIDDKLAAAASKEFVDVVEKSRGAIQKCYEKALRTDTKLQSRSVTLSVQASFSPTGSFQSSAFSPSLGTDFDSCIHGVASKWQLTTTSPAMTFKAQVSLTPS